VEQPLPPGQTSGEVTSPTQGIQDMKAAIQSNITMLGRTKTLIQKIGDLLIGRKPPSAA
jgi:hypothetical protein